MLAEVRRPVEIVQEELRRVMESAAFQKVPVGSGKPRALPGAQQRPLLAEGGVLDGSRAKRLGAVELHQQTVAIGLLGHRALCIADCRRLIALNTRTAAFYARLSALKG